MGDGNFLRATHLRDSPVNRAGCAEFRLLSALTSLASGATYETRMHRSSEVVLQDAANGAASAGPIARTAGDERLFVTEPPCISCIAAMLQFTRRFPEVSLAVSIDSTLLRCARAIRIRSGAR